MGDENKKSPGDVADAASYMLQGTSSGRQVGKSAILGHNYSVKDIKIDEEVLKKFEKLYKGIYMDDRTAKVDKLKGRRKELQSHLDKIDRCIEQAGKLQFKEGNVIFSKEHGPVVVSEVIVDIEDPGYMSDPAAKEPFKFFYKGYAKGGQVAIKAEDALPYNETTKLLYEKNKP